MQTILTELLQNSGYFDKTWRYIELENGREMGDEQVLGT